MRSISAPSTCSDRVICASDQRGYASVRAPALRVILHARDHVGEIGKRVDAARLTRRDERVEPSDTRARLNVTDEEVVLATERDAPE